MGVFITKTVVYIAKIGLPSPRSCRHRYNSIFIAASCSKNIQIIYLNWLLQFSVLPNNILLISVNLWANLIKCLRVSRQCVYKATFHGDLPTHWLDGRGVGA